MAFQFQSVAAVAPLPGQTFGVGLADIGMLIGLYFAPGIALALGMISGQPAGPFLSLPARVLKPETCAIGMGIFYTLYYGTMMLGPVVAGA
jgi:hypothetical protein